jgi:hypothetical protein
MTCMQIHQAISARLDGEDPVIDEPVWLLSRPAPRRVQLA